MRLTRRVLKMGLIVLFTLSSLMISGRSVQAWGRYGHRAAGKLAESRLSPAALKAVRELLEPGESLADASTWADEVRRDFPRSGPWHYVNVPITEEKFDARFCSDSGCVISKIKEFRKVINDREVPRVKRQQALRFLTHFVEDMHQPLHVGDQHDRGGNDAQVQFFGHGSNLHRVWDSGLLERAYIDDLALLKEITVLAGSAEAAGWSGGSVESWADESLDAAKRAYLQPDVDAPLRMGAKLGQAYQDIHLPVACRRVTQAGMRLARILNEAFETP